MLSANRYKYIRENGSQAEVYSIDNPPDILIQPYRIQWGIDNIRFNNNQYNGSMVISVESTFPMNGMVADDLKSWHMLLVVLYGNEYEFEYATDSLYIPFTSFIANILDTSSNFEPSGFKYMGVDANYMHYFEVEVVIDYVPYYFQFSISHADFHTTTGTESGLNSVIGVILTLLSSVTS